MRRRPREPVALGDRFLGNARAERRDGPPRDAQLERFNREIARRTDVVGIFPDDQPVIRLVSMLAIEPNDEWLVGRGYIAQHSMAALYDSKEETEPAGRNDTHRKGASELIAA